MNAFLQETACYLLRNSIMYCIIIGCYYSRNGSRALLKAEKIICQHSKENLSVFYDKKTHNSHVMNESLYHAPVTLIRCVCALNKQGAEACYQTLVIT